MRTIFKCQHKSKHLAVARDETKKYLDEDFSKVTYHLFCQNCGEHIDVSYAKMRYSAKEFLNRKPV